MNKLDFATNLTFNSISCSYHTETNPDTGEPNFIQRLNSDKADINALVFLKNDFEISKKLNNDQILKSYKMTQNINGYQIHKEYFNGIPLTEYLKDWEFNLLHFIELASRISNIIKTLHASKIIVKDFIIENILINPDSCEVKLCSLGYATELKREVVVEQLDKSLMNSLWHIAPEQTGRIARSIDYRSDFYALGIILYQLATGRRPFDQKNPSELIHAHIAKKATPPSSFNPKIPKIIDDLIAKLMSKDIEERYQSDTGILEDLSFLKESIKNNQKLDGFQLAQQDFSNIFFMSEKLYGRKKELEQLRIAWDRTRKNSCSIMMVSGFSGIGKTRLVNELRNSVLADSELYASGKFDQLNIESSYSGIISALKGIIQKILTESEENKIQWEKAISENTNDDIFFLSELIPEIKLLINSEIFEIKVGPIEGQKRLRQSIIDFLKTISIQNKSLVLFIDDLQWADTDSLDLIVEIIASKTSNLFIIGAYRDNEVNASHKLNITLNTIKEKFPQSIESLKVNELRTEDINALLSDSLKRDPEDTLILTNHVTSKTGGNPFFVKEFLYHFLDSQKIFFNVESKQWEWNLDEIKETEISEYVINLLLKKLSKLSAQSQDLICLSACIGATFDFNTLLLISGKSSEELSNMLWELTLEEYIMPLDNWGKFHTSITLDADDLRQDVNYHFKFQHDRIQQAAYSTLSQDQQRKKHYQIAQILYSQFSNEDLDKNLFDVLNHYLLGKAFITSQNEKERIKNLSQRAGDKAFRNNVINQAYKYYSLGLDLMEQDESSEIFKALLLGKSECSYLLGMHDESEFLFEQAISNASTNLRKADILSRKMALYENTQRHALAIDTARDALKLLGVKLPERTTQVHVLRELLKVKILLRGKSIDQLLGNPKMESPERIIIMKILMNLWGPAYLLQKQELLAFKILKMVNYSIKYGNSIESALAYAFYGYVISAQMKDYTKGCEFANLGLELNKILDDQTLRSKVIVIAEGCVAHWNRPYKSMLDQIRTGFNVGIESNDIIYAGYATTFMNRNNFLSGKNLDLILSEAKDFMKFVSNVGAEISRQQMLPWLRLVFKLTGKSPTEEYFGDLIEEEKNIAFISKMNTEMNVQLPLAQHFTMSSIYHYFNNDYERAYEFALLADPYMMSVIGLVEWAEQIVFRTLAAIAVIQRRKSLPLKEKRLLRKNLKLMSKWAIAAPENFKAKYLLAKAEYGKLNPKANNSEQLYKDAILAAEDAGLIQISALALESLGKFYRDNNQTDKAHNLYRRAILAYHTWGASAKVRQIEEKLKSMGFKSMNNDNELRHKIQGESLDLKSILDASQILSGEVKPDSLMNKLLLILIQNAGAQNAYLIKENNRKLQLVSSSQMSNNHQYVKHQLPIEKVENIPHGVVRKAYNYKETILINDAQYEKTISSLLPKDIESKSILCLPILSQDQVIAIIYLDNYLSKNVFSRNRIELIRMLSSQIAISIENADLYQSLEDRVSERTKEVENQKIELEKSKLKSDELLYNILPKEIATELKSAGACKPRRFNSVSIMFTDFEQFTKMSEKLTPEELVDIVDYQFKVFDTIIEKYGIEKIKTIGDSYMCAGGLPKEDSEHAVKTVQAALEISAFVESFVEERKAANLPYCRMRIGIHSGPIIAGIVGHKKFAYDIWGDAVNTASRMESASEPGKVNISSSTYSLIKDKFECNHRGKIQAKNKGDIDMYYVKTQKT